MINQGVTKTLMNLHHAMNLNLQFQQSIFIRLAMFLIFICGLQQNSKWDFKNLTQL